jgi:hypothetical protein
MHKEKPVANYCSREVMRNQLPLSLPLPQQQTKLNTSAQWMLPPQVLTTAFQQDYSTHSGILH